MKGNYVIENNIQNRSFSDPFSIENNADGIRANVGGKVRMGWFSINSDYTFQDYNNLSVGLNFDLYNKQR